MSRRMVRGRNIKEKQSCNLIMPKKDKSGDCKRYIFGVETFGKDILFLNHWLLI